jgi:hypothetical protein
MEVSPWSLSTLHGSEVLKCLRVGIVEVLKSRSDPSHWLQEDTWQQIREFKEIEFREIVWSK